MIAGFGFALIAATMLGLGGVTAAGYVLEELQNASSR